MNERIKNYGRLWSTHDGPNDNKNSRCYEIKREYKSVECEEMMLIIDSNVIDY